MCEARADIASMVMRSVVYTLNDSIHFILVQETVSPQGWSIVSVSFNMLFETYV